VSVNLLIIFPSMERGGAEGYALTIARAALAIGWRVSVASPPAEGTRELVQTFQAIGAEWRPVGIGRGATVLGRRPKSLVPWIEGLNALRLFRQVRPDVALIVLPGPSACFAVQVAAALLRMPAASCFQLTPRAPWTASPLRQRLLAWARRRGQAWLCVSEHNAEFVAAAFAVPRVELRVIHNGTPLNSVARDSKIRGGILEELGLSNDALLVLTVARLGMQKAHAVLLEAIPDILRLHPNVHFLWIGEGEQREALQQRIQTLGVGARVHLLGFRDDVPRYLAAADLFAIPTHYEGLPFSLVEAMAAGLPVVASVVSGIPEVLEDGAVGLLVEENTPESWRAGVCALLDDPARCAALGLAARHRAQHYDEARMTGDTLALLEHLAQARP
jgi:glycosyltransferase involved in cell wall biosynthesis